MSKEIFLNINNASGWRNTKKLWDYLKDVPEGKYKITIEKSNKRSSQQNRYYFGLVVPLVQQGIKELGTDLTKEETHEFLKARFNGSDLINTETGEAINLPLSTTRLNKEQFGEYIEKIQQFAAEFLHTIIPDPGEQLEIYENA